MEEAWYLEILLLKLGPPLVEQLRSIKGVFEIEHEKVKSLGSPVNPETCLMVIGSKLPSNPKVVNVMRKRRWGQHLTKAKLMRHQVSLIAHESISFRPKVKAKGK